MNIYFITSSGYKTIINTSQNDTIKQLLEKYVQKIGED